MLRIIVNDQDLVLPKGAFLPLRGKSPLFSYTMLPGEIILPFSIPYRENAAVLGFPADPSVVDQDLEFDCTVFVNGVWKLTGKLVMESCSTRNVEVAFVRSLVDFDEQLSQTKLAELALGSVSICSGTITVYYDFDHTGTGNGTNYEVHIGAITFSTTTTPGESISDILDDMETVINASSGVTGIAADHVDTTVLRIQQTISSPVPDALSEPENIYTSGGGLISLGDFVSWIKTWHDQFVGQLYTNRNLYYPDVSLTFPVVKHADFYGREGDSLNDSYQGYLNYYDTLAHEFVANYDPDGGAWLGNVYTFVPFVFARYVLEKICTIAGITLTGSFLEVEDFNRLIIDNARSMAFEFTDPDSGDVYLVMKNTIEVANHMPDLTVSGFLQAIRNKCNLFVSYDPVLRQLSLQSREIIFSNRVVNDWNAKPFLGDPPMRMDQVRGIRFTSPLNSADDMVGKYTDFLYTDYLQQDDYQIALDDLTIESPMSHPTIQHVSGGTPTLSQWKIPVRQYTGSGDEFDLGYIAHHPGLLIYRGMDQDSFGDTYPYATHDDLSSTDNSEGNDISLQWKRNAELLWPMWSDFIQNAPAMSITMVLSMADVMLINYAEWYKIQGADWLVDEWQIDRVIGDDFYVTMTVRKNRALI